MIRRLFTTTMCALFLACGTESEITKESTALLDASIQSIVINNSYIPIEIEGVAGDQIIFKSGGMISLFTTDDTINKPIIKISENSALIYFQVFEDNQASYSFNNNGKNKPWLRLLIPETFAGELTVNNYGYNAKATIKNFPNLNSFTYMVIDSDLKMEKVHGIHSTFYLNSADLNAVDFEFDNTTIYAQTSCTISLNGFPGNLFVTTQNYMPFKATYNRYNGEFIDIRAYSGGGELNLPKTAAFAYDLFSTTGTLIFTGFDNNSAQTNLTNKKRGTVSGSSAVGEIYYNSYTNSFTVRGK